MSISKIGLTPTYSKQNVENNKKSDISFGMKVKLADGCIERLYTQFEEKVQGNQDIDALRKILQDAVSFMYLSIIKHNKSFVDQMIAPERELVVSNIDVLSLRPAQKIGESKSFPHLELSLKTIDADKTENPFGSGFFSNRDKDFYVSNRGYTSDSIARTLQRNVMAKEGIRYPFSYKVEDELRAMSDEDAAKFVEMVTNAK